jgi:hypothetical protein
MQREQMAQRLYRIKGIQVLEGACELRVSPISKRVG